MKLIKCPACGHEISEQALSCPNCGQPLNHVTANAISEPAASLSSGPGPYSELTKLPSKVRLYYLTLILLITLAVSFLGAFAHEWWAFFWGIFIIFGIPAWIFMSVQLSVIRYQVLGNKINVMGGVLAKYTTSLPFSSVQNAVTSSGVLLRMFKLKKLSIWNSSSAQIVVRKGNSENKPSIRLLLNREDADAIQQLILSGK